MFSHAIRISCVALSCLFVVARTPLAAEGWLPSEPIKLVTPFAPGGLADFVGRAVADSLSKALHQTVIVLNRPGANGNIAVPTVTRANADGYTLLLATSGIMAVNPFLYSSVTYDALRDLKPVSIIFESPLVVTVNPASNIKSLKDLIERARENPGVVNYASSGRGTFAHLAAELLKARAKVDITHIPYRGELLGIQDIIAGQVEMGIFTVGGSKALIDAGRLRALAVTTKNRVASMPDVPTVEEEGIADYDLSFWYGVFVPKETPANIVATLNQALIGMMANPVIKEALQHQGLVGLSLDSQQSLELIGSDLKKYESLVKSIGIKPE